MASVFVLYAVLFPGLSFINPDGNIFPMKITETDANRLISIMDDAESALADNLMPFWARNTWDEGYGGFLTRLDRRGELLERDEKVLMMQVRLIYAFSAAHLHELTGLPYLDLAKKGFDYLVSTMWDKSRGGFYYSVSREGAPLSSRKNTDFHGYTMTGLARHYLASGSKEALDYAERVFHLLLSDAADRDMGFIEDFDGGDWGALNDEQMNLGGRQKIKTIDMHTNVLEGMMYLCKVSRDPRVPAALKQLLDLICARGIFHDHGCTVTAFDYEWNPVRDANGRFTTSYGLNVELAWIVLDAVDALGLSREKYRRVILDLIDHALDHGFDHERGGLAAYGPLKGDVVAASDLPENRLVKTWWAQAEMLNALIAAWEWTEQEKYLRAFMKLFDWVQTRQIDHECGDWYQEVDWTTGRPLTYDKGREFKTAFHAARALIRVADGLRRILGTPAAP